MTNLVDVLHIPDTQGTRDDRHLAIQRVGIRRVRYPLQLRIEGAGDLRHVDLDRGGAPGQQGDGRPAGVGGGGRPGDHGTVLGHGHARHRFGRGAAEGSGRLPGRAVRRDEGGQGRACLPGDHDPAWTAVHQAGLAPPVVTAGGIGSFAEAEAILARGDADIIGAARATLADPDWFAKARLGRGAEVRRCEYTNYCEALDQQHKQVTCKLWDHVALEEPGIARDATGRRRLLAPPWTR